jgi:hypothetical protein
LRFIPDNDFAFVIEVGHGAQSHPKLDGSHTPAISRYALNAGFNLRSNEVIALLGKLQFSAQVLCGKGGIL